MIEPDNHIIKFISTCFRNPVQERPNTLEVAQDKVSGWLSNVRRSLNSPEVKQMSLFILFGEFDTYYG